MGLPVIFRGNQPVPHIAYQAGKDVTISDFRILISVHWGADRQVARALNETHL